MPDRGIGTLQAAANMGVPDDMTPTFGLLGGERCHEMHTSAALALPSVDGAGESQERPPTDAQSADGSADAGAFEDRLERSPRTARIQKYTYRRTT